ncbi:SusC/RagA family TonB-linked outer membrane protein [Flavobacterium aquidurense]|uniref:SusC/RagA family TonB-linked outer membrane protein n=1 Tax=Flavobacterium aquidurense TaxID=362413 RepID=UPI003757E3FF
MKNLSFNKGRPYCLCIFIFAILLSNHSNATGLTFRTYTKQLQHQITGTVTDVTGPLPSVTVIVKGTTTSAVTDEKGNFSITANSTDVLVFSFIGYATQEIMVGNQTSITVILAEDSTQLKEVTINAGYYSVNDKERTGSIARITSKDIETQPVNNVLATMQGRMAGVEITQNTGIAGGGFEIQIRGRNSIRSDGNAPLFIIDGVPYSSEAIGFSGTMSVLNTFTSPLNNLNPADIQSIEVLKDADATSIYGSRGANGVVLITTKKGKAGQTKVNVNFSSGVAQVAHFMDLLNTQQYLTVRAEAFQNDGITEYPEGAYDINGTWDPNRYTDWQKKLLGNSAQITNLSAGIQGGSEYTQFLLSSNFNHETTVFPGYYGYKKANVRTSISHQSKDKRFHLDFSGGYTVQHNNQPLADPTLEAITAPPNAPEMYDAQGNINWENNTFENNPARNFLGSSQSQTYDLIANIQLSYKVSQDITLKTSLGYTDLKHHEASAYPYTIYLPNYGLGAESSAIYYNDVARRSWIIEPQLNWKKLWGRLQTDLLGGATFQRQDNEQIAMSALGFAHNSLMNNPAAATYLTVSGNDESIYKYQALFGRLNLQLDNRYIVNLTGRRDGSSRFGPSNRFAWFGAIGAAWIFSSEDWFVKQDVLSLGKLRASYGITGNDQIGNYQYLDSYGTSGNNYQGIPGLQPSRLYNPDFGWETNKKLEFALETGFLQDKIQFTAGWYRNHSSNQLVGVPMPGTTGFPSLQANLDATVENKGIELTLQTTNIQTKDFSWTTDFNFTSVKNKLVSFPGLENSTYSNQYVIGQPLNIIKLFHYTGLDSQSGIYTFEDINGDGSINSPSDKQVLLNLNPKFYGGVQNQFRYKNWQLDFLLQFVKQDNIDPRKIIGVPGEMGNRSTQILDHWSAPGNSDAVQLYTTGVNSDAESAFFNYAASDAVITDASYIRLKNLQLSYNLPAKWIGNTKCRLYLQGQNLLTFTSFKGADPEFRAVGTLPPLRILTIGTQISF